MNRRNSEIISLRVLRRFAQRVLPFLAMQCGRLRFAEAGACPLCASGESDPEWEGRQYGLPVRLRRCRGCGLVVQSPRLDPASLARFYKKYYRLPTRTAGDKERQFRREMRRGQEFAAFLEEAAPQSLAGAPRVADIGCGHGGILAHFKARGCRVAGCDIDEDSIGYGREQGLDLRAGTHETLGLDDAELLILSHVLEHIAEPLPFLRSLRGLCRREGTLLLEVPEYVRGRTRQVQVAHLLYFEESTLRRVLEESGWKVLRLVAAKDRMRALCAPS